MVDVKRREAAKAVLDAAGTLARRAGAMHYFVTSAQEHLLPGGTGDRQPR